MAKITRILTYTGDASDLRDHLRKRGVKGSMPPGLAHVSGLSIKEQFIHAGELDGLDIGTNIDDVIADTFIRE